MTDLNDKALVSAVVAYEKSTGAERYQTEGWIEDAISSAIHAYLSALTNTSGDDEAPVSQKLWDQLQVLSGYYIVRPPTPDDEFVSVCNGDLRKMVELMANARPQSAAVRDVWQPIETAPKDGTVIQAWHSVNQCPMSVLWKDEGFPFKGERLNWYERSYTTAWPERAFSHWMPLPAAPAIHSTQEG